MSGTVVAVHVYTDSIPLTLPLGSDLTAEDACIQASKRIKIGPKGRHLFALRFHNSNIWLCPNFLLADAKQKEFDLRLRFKVPNHYVLAKIDSGAFNYYFHQVSNDLQNEKIPGITYDEHKGTLVGLGIMSMQRLVVEEGIGRSVLINDYKKFLPKEFVKGSLSIFVKRVVLENLESMSNKVDSRLIKAEYLTKFENIAPNYMIETYKAVTEYDGEPCHISIKINPYDSEMPGILFCIRGTKEWQRLCTVEDLCYLSVRNDGTVEISRRNGIPSYLKFEDNRIMYSFVGLIDGYYRLMVKWTFNLCKDVATPSLLKLHKLKCHGPVGGEFSYRKLEEKREKKPGCFILRESELYYDTFVIDVCVPDRLEPSNRIKSYNITKMPNGDYEFQFHKKTYPTILDLINAHRSKEGALVLEECVPPSEYDNAPRLLQQKNNIKGDGTSSNPGNMDGLMSGGPLCIDLRDMQLYKGHKTLKTGSICIVYRSVWRAAKGKKVEVALKALKPEFAESRLREFLDLANRWAFIRSNSIVKLYGITLSNPVTMVMEYLKLGPLDSYLKENKHRMKTVDLVEASAYLATALWDLEEQGFVHGNIRCRKIMVCAHDDRAFKVKLSDPGLHEYSHNDVYWIPVECYANPLCAQTSVAADVWAFGTSLWEIFSFGESLPHPDCVEAIQAKYLRGMKLPIPNGCPHEVYSLMLECWDLDFHSRKKPQAVMRDINQILYQVFNSRQNHSYATTFPRGFEGTQGDPDSHTSISSSSIFSGATGVTVLPSGGEDNSILSGSTDHLLGSSMFQDLSPGFSAGSSLEAASLLRSLQDQDDQSQYSLGFSPVLQPFRFPNENASLDSVTPIFELNGDCNIVLQGRIGQGFYGEVYRGRLERDKDCEEEVVAVKKLKTNALLSCLEDFQREIDIMKTLRHPNIVEIKGVLEEGDVSLVMEYVKHGSLLSYLKINRDTLTDQTLLKFALDVAEGMEYLGTKKIVHRDLAARNILVASENLVKISDFGLAQVMGQNNYYILKTNRELPIKWYAPESLRDGKFSPRSDVWSYGVTLFEMFSRGEDPRLKPPPDQKGGKNCGKQTSPGTPRDERLEQEILLQTLESGTRLPCPTRCPSNIYSDLIAPCWKFHSQERPSFTDLVRTVTTLMDT
ncbi:tyrosine-protein kinase JAK2 [Ischnura elegans]|uniref:tyrosine-protein kinase JAK2 n=1 Tax=Ischnura elegans TaxID=197161 RepID=UPI001ED8A0B5|nr:tyrosine-protein kinase JAK2 [Ischnura elegans]